MQMYLNNVIFIYLVYLYTYLFIGTKSLNILMKYWMLMQMHLRKYSVLKRHMIFALFHRIYKYNICTSVYKLKRASFTMKTLSLCLEVIIEFKK